MVSGGVSYFCSYYPMIRLVYVGTNFVPMSVPDFVGEVFHWTWNNWFLHEFKAFYDNMSIDKCFVSNEELFNPIFNGLYSVAVWNVAIYTFTTCKYYGLPHLEDVSENLYHLRVWWKVSIGCLGHSLDGVSRKFRPPIIGLSFSKVGASIVTQKSFVL